MTAYVVDVRAVAQPLEEGGPEKAVADLTLRAEAIRDRLDEVLGPGGYSCRFEPSPQSSRPTIYCHLQVGKATRTGIGEGGTLPVARKSALAEAALGFGIGRAGREVSPVLTDYKTSHVFPTGTRHRVEENAEDPESREYWTPDGDRPGASVPGGSSSDQTSHAESSREA